MLVRGLFTWNEVCTTTKSMMIIRIIYGEIFVHVLLVGTIMVHLHWIHCGAFALNDMVVVFITAFHKHSLTVATWLGRRDFLGFYCLFHSKASLFLQFLQFYSGPTNNVLNQRCADITVKFRIIPKKQLRNIITRLKV